MYTEYTKNISLSRGHWKNFFEGVILGTLGIREDLKEWGFPTVSHPEMGRQENGPLSFVMPRSLT